MKRLGLDELPMPWARNARHVAICGWPKSGKDEVARMLEDEFNGVVVDDGAILRETLPILLGIDPMLPYSQNGKATRVSVGDRSEQVREGLGELGNWLEDRYGPYIMPIRAMQTAQEKHPDANFYIYPSVRKEQGRAYKMAGGVVIEVARPGVGDSGNEFDCYDRKLVDITLTNDGTLDDLRALVKSLPLLLADLQPS